MPKVIILVSLLAFGSVPVARPATWYVDSSLPESGDGTSWQTAFTRIQEGVEAASDGDTVVAAEGAYFGVHFKGKNISLLSTNPHDPRVVAATIMDGYAVRFSGVEDQTCVLSGFTIRGATGRGVGGGVYGAGTRATISHNVITGNFALFSGGGVAECHGLIENNVITGNSAGNPLRHGLGGGLYRCNAVIRNNVIAGNRALSASEYVPGGPQWVEGEGGGLYDCQGTIVNNTIFGNLGLPGGLYGCHGDIRNNIIWGNLMPWGTPGWQLADSMDPAYSCVEGWTGGGWGNIAEDPLFVDAENGNFRLTPCSPCIDKGDSWAVYLPDTDIAGIPRIMGFYFLAPDMGAYEVVLAKLERGPGGGRVELTWAWWPGATWTVLYSDDLLTWRVADDNAPFRPLDTISWIDDGSKTGTPPWLVPRRFYRVLQNP